MKNKSIIFFVYIVRCSDETYYTGITNDLKRRVYEHNHKNDPNSYTNNRKPVELVYYEEFSNPMDAIRREKQIKGWSRDKKEALIQGDTNRLVELSKRSGVRKRK